MTMIVLFGRPGAGKTTLANAVKVKLSGKNGENSVKCLDLDICIPQWMKDNFAKGIYPTLKQRQQFADGFCDYVDSELAKDNSERGPDQAPSVFVISFSFVNNDLRDTYRSRFPNAIWILMDTPEDEAAKRIKRREGHFYKVTEETKKKQREQQHDAPNQDGRDNGEWQFDPVLFSHTTLNGIDNVEENSNKVLNAIQEQTKC